MRRLGTPTLVLAALAAVAAARGALGADAPKPVAVGGTVVGVLEPPGLFRHTGAYAPLRVTWQRDARVRRVLGVFPHPVLGGRVLLATAAGLVASDDAGATWQPLPAAATDQVGVVRHVAFVPDAPDAFYLASDSRGVFLSEDAGKTVRQVGSKASGMASDATAGVCVYTGDRRLRTVLVIHGEAAPGISWTTDAGRTWRVIHPDCYVRRIIAGTGGGGVLFLVASKTDAPAVQSVYHAVAPEDYWIDVVRDVVPTDAAISVFVRRSDWTHEVFHGAAPYVSTADAGMYRLTAGDGVRIGPADVTAWASVAVAWGPNADVQVLCAYEPTRLGMVVSTDELQTFAPQSAGLFTGPFVREGARLRAAADGKTFYAIANDDLYLGRAQPVAIDVARAAVAPPVLAFEQTAFTEAVRALRDEVRRFPDARQAAQAARRLLARVQAARATSSAIGFQVTARVTAPKDAPPAGVTVDLSRLGASPVTPLFDDGQHGDGAAGDGTYGATFRVDPARLRQFSEEWRRPWPGVIGLSVTAVGADGRLAGAVAPLGVFERLESFALVSWRDDFQTAAGKPWRKEYGSVYYPRDVEGFHALSFWIRREGAGGEDVRVQLLDTPPYAPPTTTPPVAVEAEGFVEGGRIAAEFRRVVIPLRRLLKDAPAFRTRLMTTVVLSGEGRAAATYGVKDMWFHLSADDLKPAQGAPSP